MKGLLKEFKSLLEEGDTFPIDELRDYYLVPAKTLFASNPYLANETYDNQTPLMMVVKQIIKKNKHVIRDNNLNMLAWEIIEQTSEAMLNYQDKEGNSVIHMASQMECFSVGLLDLMKDFGANFALANKKGETPLMIVSGNDSLDDVKFIHAYTPEPIINAHDKMTGATALIRAVKAKKINNVFFLLENGASVFEKDNQGKLAFEYIKKASGSEDLKELMCLFAEKEKTENAIRQMAKGK
jgi:ankyrin repeat protein